MTGTGAGFLRRCAATCFIPANGFFHGLSFSDRPFPVASMRKPGMAGRRGAWALARFLHRDQFPGEKEKSALAGCQLSLMAPNRGAPNALRPLQRAFFSFSPASETHGAQRRATAHSPGLLQAHARHSLRLSMPLFWFWWHRLSSLCHRDAKGSWPRMNTDQQG